MTTLRRIYTKNRVKRKKVRQEKFMPENVRRSFPQQCRELRDRLAQARQQGLRMIWLDEINFTKRSVSLREYSNCNTNLTVD